MSNGKPVCEARLTFASCPIPTPKFRKTMIEMGKKVGIPGRGAITK